MSQLVICCECGDRMALTDKGVERMKIEGETLETSRFICDDCIDEFDYAKEVKN